MSERWSYAQKLAAFSKADPIFGSSDRMIEDMRIRWSEYGLESEFGWVMDHYPIPQAAGGPDADWNLRARHWRKNKQHGGIFGAFLSDAPNTPEGKKSAASMAEMLMGLWGPDNSNVVSGIAGMGAFSAPQPSPPKNGLMGLYTALLQTPPPQAPLGLFGLGIHPFDKK